MADTATVSPLDRLLCVVPKNCPKWTERLTEYAVNEIAGDLAAAGTDAQAVTQAKEVVNALRDRFWDDSRARGKEPKPREKKRKAEEAPSEEVQQVREQQMAARGNVMRLHRKIKALVVTASTEEEYKKLSRLVDNLGEEVQAALLWHSVVTLLNIPNKIRFKKDVVRWRRF
jgi:hypothetical protein